jgi:teichuronic acid biosynthesis glycosyltransferase TuaG
MSPMPRVSVIMPAYNATRFIGESIASVQAQSVPDWELLVVDDGSTDDTAARVRALAAADPRIRLFRFPRNTGLAAAARNYAMKRVRGGYIAFLDADDLWEPAKLARQLASIQDDPALDAVCSYYDVFGDPERAARWRSMMWRFPAGPVTMEQVLQQSITTSTVLMRRSCMEQLGGMIVSRRLTTGEDTEYWIRLVARHRVLRLGEVLARYRVSPVGDSLSTVALERKRDRDRELLRRVTRGGCLTPAQRRLYTSIFHYNRSRDALFHDNRPFRADLLRSIAAGRPPLKACVMAALCWLPAPVLRQVLTALLSLRNNTASTPTTSDPASR